MIKKAREPLIFWESMEIYYYMMMRCYSSEKETLHNVLFLNAYYQKCKDIH